MENEYSVPGPMSDAVCVCVCVVGGGEGTEQNPCPLEANILVMAF